MKIAITADLHLTSKNNNPERYHALENILEYLHENKINTLIIAGDLFDKNIFNYSAFEKYFKNSDYSNIQIYIIPGNHDSQLQGKDFSIQNVRVIEEAEIFPLDGTGKLFLFVPYRVDKSMGEIIANFDPELEAGSWILVSHGDYMGGMKEPNPYETGTYLPLTQKDIHQFSPQQVFLGHIHNPHNINKVNYPGSPCPVTRSETGRRRFLIYDTENNSITKKRVNADIIYFNDSITVIPSENEIEMVKQQIHGVLNRLKIDEDEKSRAVLNLDIRGYSKNKKVLKKEMNSTLEGYTIDGESGVDLSNVRIADESAERIAMIQKVQQYIDKLQWNDNEELKPGRDKIKIKAMKTIIEG